MKIALFDWTTGGHHSIYLKRFASTLCSRADIVAAIPDEAAPALSGMPITIYSLGDARPHTDFGRPLPAQNRILAEDELDLFEKAARDISPDHLVHLYSDPIVRSLVRRKCLEVPVTLCIFFPRAHYPAAYGTPLSPKEKMRAWFLEYLIFRWKQRRDAHGLFALDEEAARRWAIRGKVAVAWLPEPPINGEHAVNDGERSGVAVYGAIAARKGIHLLSDAIVRCKVRPLKVTLAGPVEHGFEKQFSDCVDKMRASGADLDMRLYTHTEKEGLQVLAKAQCAVLSYPKHYGMSRVLLEACSVNTPILAHNWGLLGYLVRNHGVGIAVDCTNPTLFSRAIETLCGEGSDYRVEAGAFELFTQKFSVGSFDQAVRSVFRV